MTARCKRVAEPKFRTGESTGTFALRNRAALLDANDTIEDQCKAFYDKIRRDIGSGGK